MAVLISLACVIIVLLLLKLYLKVTTGWCISQVNLKGKTAIVTGANTGIGYKTAADLAKRGAKVILACRNEAKAQLATENLKMATHNPEITYKIVDLSSMKSVRQFADDINATETRLDLLINNAGLHKLPGAGTTGDGFEPIMATNYFGPFLLTYLLLDLLKKSGPSRIVNVASLAGSMIVLNLQNLNHPGLTGHEPYFRSKLCNILFTMGLSKRLVGTSVTTYSLHPGVILSEFTRNVPFKFIVDFVIKWFFKDTIEGAQTTIHCAVANGLEKHSGKHFHDCQVVRKYLVARNEELAKALFDTTKELLNIYIDTFRL